MGWRHWTLCHVRGSTMNKWMEDWMGVIILVAVFTVFYGAFVGGWWLLITVVRGVL